jgi:hypothetical protein
MPEYRTHDLLFVVKSGGEMLGTLRMGRGSVQWFAPKAQETYRKMDMEGVRETVGPQITGQTHGCASVKYR